MPVELAIDLAGLALYDVVIYADDSGSMAFEEDGSRIDDLKLVLSRTAEVRRAARKALKCFPMLQIAGSGARRSGVKSCFCFGLFRSCSAAWGGVRRRVGFLQGFGLGRVRGWLSERVFLPWPAWWVEAQCPR